MRRLRSSMLVGLVLGVAASTAVRAVELRVFAGGALAMPLTQLATQFEKNTGDRVVLRFGTTPELVHLIDSGEPFDLLVGPADVLRDAQARAAFEPAASIDIVHAGLGVAVRAGASHPDIGTPDALRQTLLAAHAVATIPASATGSRIQQVFAALHITDAMASKLRVQNTPAQIVQAVTSGQADLAIFLTNVLTAPGLDVVGPFPQSLQNDVVFTSAVAANAAHARAAHAFVHYLRGAAAGAVFKADGLTPGR